MLGSTIAGKDDNRAIILSAKESPRVLFVSGEVGQINSTILNDLTKGEERVLNTLCKHCFWRCVAWEI